MAQLSVCVAGWPDQDANTLLTVIDELDTGRVQRRDDLVQG